MGIKLFILSKWTPDYVLRKELENVHRVTTNALKTLLEIHAPYAFAKVASEITLPPGNVQEKRTTMAKEHVLLVNALSEAVGRDQAISLGRKTLFEVGKSLGKETREKLGIRDRPKDLISAAKVLYRVLGITFEVEWQGKTNATLVVNRCALANEYSELTCLVLSATDEGVIRGIEPNVSMFFKERMTGGCNKCTAQIEFNQKGE
jgi:hypothetical protein